MAPSLPPSPSTPPPPPLCSVTAIANHHHHHHHDNIIFWSSEEILPEEELFPTVSRGLAVSLTLIIALSPLLSMIIFVSGAHNVFIAMIAMHWLCMVVLPLVYISTLVKSFRYYRNFFRGQALRMPLQWKWGILGFTVFSVLVFSLYLLAKCDHWNSTFCAHMKSKALEEGFSLPQWSLALFGAYFSVVNPVVEEFFWRLFLYRELGGQLFLHPNGQVLHPSESAPLLLFGGSSQAPEDGREIQFFESKTGKEKETSSTGDEIGEGGGGEKRRAGRAATLCPEESMGPDEEGLWSDKLGEEEGEECSAGKRFTKMHSCDTVIAAVAESQQVLTGNTFHTPSPSGSSCSADTTITSLSPGSSFSSSPKPTEQVFSIRDTTTAIPPFHDLRLTIFGQLCLSILYASYHVCVVYHLLGVIYAVLVFFGLVVLGIVLIFVRNHPRWGFLTAIMIHAGVDFGAVLAYANVFLKFI